MRKSVADNPQLQDVNHAVREIWYSYAEGLLPKVTGTTDDDRLYLLIDKRMPNGWTASIQPSGSVYASRPVFNRKSLVVMIVEKRADGFERTFEVAL